MIVVGSVYIIYPPYTYSPEMTTEPQLNGPISKPPLISITPEYLRSNLAEAYKNSSGKHRESHQISR